MFNNFSAEIEDFWKFNKLIETANLKQWRRNMKFILNDVELWHYVDDFEKQFKVFSKKTLNTLTWNEKKNFEKKIKNYIFKMINAKNKIESMCNDIIKIIIQINWIAKQIWDHFITRYSFQNWFNKWATLNRFRTVNFSNHDSIFNWSVKIIVLKQKIKNLSIIMNDFIIISTFNIFESEWEIYVTILNDKIKNIDKFSNFDELLKDIEQKKIRMKTTSVNFIKHDDVDRDRNENRDKNRDRNRDEAERDENNDRNITKKIKCKWCDEKHLYDKKHCSHKNIICNNCHRKSHKTVNCFHENEDKHEKFKKKNDNKNENIEFFKTHIDFINVSIKSINENVAFNENEFFFFFEIKIDFVIIFVCIINNLRLFLFKMIYYDWILNFDVTHHCNDIRRFFKNLMFSKKIVIIVNEKKFIIEIIENVIVNLFNNEIFFLKNVMFIFNLIVDFINVKRFWSKDFNINYSTEKLCEINRREHLIAHANVQNDLFVFRIKFINNKINAIISFDKSHETINSFILSMNMIMSKIFINVFKKSTISLFIWHRRLIHLNYRNVIINVNKIIDMKNVIEFISNVLCDSCMKNRQQIEKSRVFMIKTIEFLDRIDVDIEKSLSIIFRDNKIFVLIKNEVTSMLWFFACKQKSQLYQIVVFFKTWIELQFKHKIKNIRDEEKFLSKLFDVWFKKIDIQWEQSTFYIYEQNDIIEKAMYIIMTFIRSILKNMKFSKSFWNVLNEAVIYTKNRIFTFSESFKDFITFYQTMNDALFNVSNFRALDCKVYTHISKTIKRHKLNDRSWKNIHVSYENNNQWKIYNFRIKIIHLTRNVKFDENFFYYDENAKIFVDYSKSSTKSQMIDFWNVSDDRMLKNNLKKHDRSQLHQKVTSSSAFMIFIFMFVDFFENNVSMRDDASMKDQSIKNQKKKQNDYISNEKAYDENDENEKKFENAFESIFVFSLIEELFVSFISMNFVFTFQLFVVFNFSTIIKSSRTTTKNVFKFDYKQLHRRDKNVKIYNIIDVKHDFKFHIHMRRVLNALKNEDNFDFDHIFELVSYKNALKFFYWSKWKKIMKIEINHFVDNDTWRLIKLFVERHVITNRWVFKIKYEVNDRILRFKTRWVVHEYKQKKNVDYTDTWAEVMKFFFFRTLFVIAAKKRLHAHQMNVIIVFLYDFIDIEIYVIQFDEFVVNSKLICHLIKTLYDLKQTFRVWYEIIRNFLKFLKFELTNEDANVFVFKNKKIYIAIYVNDFFIIEFNMNFINNLKKQFDQRFKMIDLKSVQYYLNIEVIRENDNILLRQIIYLTKMLKRFNMINCKIVTSSMKSKLINNILLFSFDYKIDVDILYWYESIVNSLMYVVTMTKFDIVYVFSIINRYCNNSNRTHVKTIKRIF